jgi:opacity protein-like surface antigen
MQNILSIRLAHLALCPLVLLTCQPACAAEDPVPYYLGLSQAFTADTNIFRLPKNVPVRRDLISSTALTAGLDQPLGRGKLVADIQLNTNRYRNNNQLNYNGGEGNVRLDWESINRLSGDIALYRRQSLYNAPSSNGTLSTERDVISDSGLNLGVRLGLVTLWSLEGGLAYNQTRHSSDRQVSQELNQTSGNLGIRLRPNDLWSTRLGLRQTHATYPRAEPTTLGGAVGGDYASDTIRRNDIDLSGTWTPSGASQLDARISATRQKHSLRSYRTSNLITGLLGYNWLLTGKTKLRLELVRDSAVGAGDRNFALTGQPGGDSSVSNQLVVSGNWEATAKISADAGYTYSQRKLENIGVNSSTLAIGPLTERDNTHTLGLGATYRANAHVQLGCRYTHEKRNTNNANSQLTTPYSVDTGKCQLQLRI